MRGKVGHPPGLLENPCSLSRRCWCIVLSPNKKITRKFDTTKVNGVSIEFKPDYPFNGPPKTIVSKPGDDHVDSPPIPKKSQLVLYKYFITITSTSGQTTLPDPHVLSGGSY
jgi:hypothetical protein